MSVIFLPLGFCIGLSLLAFKINSSSNNKYTNYSVVLAGGLLGVAFFICTLSVKLLQPSYIGWLLSGDPAQHFLGWQFFRNQSWSFPLGVINDLNIPSGTTITYTDSIPLFAFIFKALGPVLPTTFQYFGIWLLLNYILQGMTGLLLMRRLTSRTGLQILGTMFFIMSPIMLWRTTGHEALTAHWIILLSLYFAITRYKHLRWMALLSLSLLIHPYLFFMVFLFFGVNILEVLVTRVITFRQGLLFLTSAFIIIIVILWLIGYFYIGSSGSIGGFGIYSMNINSLFNPQGWSHYLLKDQPNATEGQYEGFNYLGLGGILLLVWSMYSIIAHKTSVPIKKYGWLLVVSFILTLIALSNVISLGSSILLEIPLPEVLSTLLGIIRASGRFFWPVYYLIILFSLYIVIKNTRTLSAAILLSLALILQYTDFSGKYLELHKMFSSNRTWDNPLKSPIWNQIDSKKYRNFLFVPGDINKQYVAFSMLAAQKNMSINAFYTAREDENREKYKQELLEDFKIGKWDSKSIYIVDNSVLSYALKNKSENDVLLVVDGFNLLIPKGKEDANFVLNKLDEHASDYQVGRTINFGMDGDSEVFKLQGWSHTEEKFTWTVGKEASLYFPLNKIYSNMNLFIKMGPFIGNNLKGQHIIIYVNGKIISNSIIRNPGEYKFLIPKEVISDNLEVTFKMPDATSPKSIDVNEDTRILGFYVESLNIK
ncbi:DUF6311 domain-containing protein [Paenibacillus polymyxa]|uniref:DUF6311 domain-containing protein n=1 Tax=Paenibacillus polymyxa TaxID=1406 RepID=UPI002ED4A205